MKLSDQWRAYKASEPVPVPVSDELADRMAALLDQREMALSKCKTNLLRVRSDLVHCYEEVDENLGLIDETLAILSKALEESNE